MSIAQSLSDVDALIVALDKLIAKKRHLKTATMQQLLTGKKRLPGFGESINNGQLTIDNDDSSVESEDNCQLSINNYQLPKGYKQTEVGVIPEDWEVDQLTNMTQNQRPISYGIVQTGKQISNGIKCIRVVDIDDGKINSSELITTSEAISNSYKRTVLEPDDLIIALRGKIGELAVVTKELQGANLTRGVALIALKKDHSSHFYQQYLSSLDSKIRLKNSLNGSALQELPIATLRNFSVAVPVLTEQHAIATVLSDMDGEIAAIEARRAKTQAIKQGMMQQLLTGKVRLLDKGIDN